MLPVVKLSFRYELHFYACQDVGGLLYSRRVNRFCSSHVVYSYPVYFLCSLPFLYIQTVRRETLFNYAHTVLYRRADDGGVLVLGKFLYRMHGVGAERLHGGVLG